MFFRLFLVSIYLFGTFINGYPSNENENPCFQFCSNNAVCVMKDNYPQCYCLPEWEGERCDRIRQFQRKSTIKLEQITRNMLRNTPCTYVPNFCANNGVCYVNDKDKLACKCPYPFDGLRCAEYSVCYNYCFNGGVCTVDIDKPKCECKENYKGERCQSAETTTPGATTTTTTVATTTDPICSYLPDGYCNSGACIIRNNLAICQCPSTHTGDRCQTQIGITQSPTQTAPPLIPGQTTATLIPGQTTLPPIIDGITCAQNPCRNGGRCFKNGNTYFCFCYSPYTGKNCENSIQG